jgi:colanic acid/amylovoran biosynthesis protein
MSGFHYSDQWGPNAGGAKLLKYRLAQKNGKRLILLPQSLGAFQEEQTRRNFIEIANYASLVYAREDSSYAYVKELGISMDHVKVSPDFTNLLAGVPLEKYRHLAGRPCLVPNYRMRDKTSAAVCQKYDEFILACLETLIQKGKEPFILIHESHDVSLGYEIQRQLSVPIPVIVEENPRYLKGILGQSSAVMGSRFHALVSALSQGVPCLVTAWTHKYMELMKSYDCTDMFVDLQASCEENLARLNLLLEDTERDALIQRIRNAIPAQEKQSRQMWETVRQVVESGVPAPSLSS